MIEIVREKSDVVLKFRTDLPSPDESGKIYFPLRGSYDFPYRAELIALHLQDLLRERVREIRSTYYEDGYSDGRNHRKKQVHFSGSL